MSEYRISIEVATQLVVNFLTRRTLYDFAVKRSIGGIISKDGFQKRLKDTYYGVMAWFCWNTPEPFLAFEEGVYDPENMPGAPTSETLVCPGSVFTYSGGFFAEDVLNFISKPAAGTIPSDRTIMKSQAIQLIGGIPNDGSAPYNKYPLGFFENRIDNDVRDFLAQPGLSHVKYFYGFDDSTTHHMQTNRIRIVLIGVDNKGNCFVPSQKPGAIMLQKSWPPPPNNLIVKAIKTYMEKSKK